MQLRKLLTLTTLLAASSIPHAQSAITQDPTPDKQHPAAIETFQLPSHGALLNAFVYIASGPGPHPAVLLLHGFPGNEKNLDLAQAIRRAGYDVLYFDYRGSWGSPGDFSFTHCIEDADAAIAYLRTPANASRLRADPNDLILIGHSMGAFVALNVAARDPEIRAVTSISAALPGVTRTISRPPGQSHELNLANLTPLIDASGLAPLNGCPAHCAQSLAGEAIANAPRWDFASLAPKLVSRPILIITSDDGLTPASDALAAALQKLDARQVTTIHIATDHSYSDHRIALEHAILDRLAQLPAR